MKDFYPLALIFIPLIAVTGIIAWALRLWIGRQLYPSRALCRVAQVGFYLVIAVFLIELSGRIWLFSMGHDPSWFPHPSILIALASTGLIYSNAHRRMRSMSPTLEEPNKTVAATAGNVALSLRSGSPKSAVPHL